MVNLLDSELPSLASQAAVELDLLLSGASVDIAAVKRLALRLQSTIIDAGSVPAHKSLAANTATVAVLGQAWNQSGTQQQQVTDVDELGNKTAEIAEKLAAVTPGHQDTALVWMRAYCLALAKCAASYRKSI
ncbi:MAG TPA: hypothetical protein VGM98_23830, partial [Schlesneria sp.]